MKDGSNIRLFTGITRNNLPPDVLLEAAVNTLESVVILGYDKDGNEFFSSSYADGAEVLWILERAKIKLLGIIDREDL